MWIVTSTVNAVHKGDKALANNGNDNPWTPERIAALLPGMLYLHELISEEIATLHQVLGHVPPHEQSGMAGLAPLPIHHGENSSKRKGGRPKGSRGQKNASYTRPADRGLGPNGGAWNLAQGSAWSGIGQNYLRAMAKRGEIPCAYQIGRRVLLPREGFMRWFNSFTGGDAPRFDSPTK